MSEPASELSGADSTDERVAANEISRILGVGPSASRLLAGAGFTTVESVKRLPPETLESLGLLPEDVQKIRAAADNGPTGTASAVGSPDGDRIVNRWMDSVRRAERPRRKRVMVPRKDSAQVLRKWVDGDDSAMEAWIVSSETERPSSSTSSRGTLGPSVSVPTDGGSAGSGGSGIQGLPPQLVEREETVVRWLTGLLDRVKSDQFEPTTIVQEVQDLQRQLFDERSRRKQREDEVEHVKRGSIAVIKYVRNREAKEREMAIQAKDVEIAELKLKFLAGETTGSRGGFVDQDPAPIPGAGTDSVSVPAGAVEKATRDTEVRLREEFADREHAFIEREAELRRRLVQLEGEIRNLRSDSQRLQDREGLLKNEKGSLSDDLEERLKELGTRERDLVARENELRTKFEEIRISAEDLERKRAPLGFKERELAAWELQLKTHKQALELEGRRVEQARLALEGGGSVVSQQEARQLDDLRNELKLKEEELRSRETLLHERMMELETLGQKSAQVEADQLHSSVVAAVTEVRTKSGVRRLDDLLFGGFPLGSQLLVNGPAHTGKDILTRLFAAEGLKLGIPTLWVVTDKAYTQIREEMTALLPTYPEFEKKGMVRYVDLYSRSLGIQQSETGVRLLSSTDKGVLEQLTQGVNNFSQELKEKFTTYRFVFESVSTVTAYLDTPSTFRFLQPFAGRRKMDGAASYYILETGMHTESDLQTLEHMMDGSINLKVDQLKTFLSIRGVTDVQSRAWVGYTFSKKAFSLGSFSLDHIR